MCSGAGCSGIERCAPFRWSRVSVVCVRSLKGPSLQQKVPSYADLRMWKRNVAAVGVTARYQAASMSKNNTQDQEVK